MKRIFLFFILLLITYSSYSQSEFKTIKISNDLELIQISANAYIHVSYVTQPNYGRIGANGLILVDKNKAFLFDSPWTDSLTRQLCVWIKDSMNLNIVGFIPNHWHWDCMGGLGYINEQNIASYANELTINIAEKNGLPLAKYGFRDSLDLKLGEKDIYCYYLGAAHTLDNIVVWIPSEQILFAGCMIKSLDFKDLGFTADGDLTEYPKTIDRLLKRFPTAKIVIPGHGQHGGIELIMHTKKLAGKN